jgi:hypothetical protein
LQDEERSWEIGARVMLDGPFQTYLTHAR